MSNLAALIEKYRAPPPTLVASKERIHACCLYRYLQGNVTFSAMRDFGEWVGGYSYCKPAERVVSKNLAVWLLISTKLTVTQLTHKTFFIEQYSLEVQELVLAMLQEKQHGRDV